MKKTAKKIYAGILIFAVSFMCLPGFAADPGSSDDPLISMSYVNNVLIPQMKIRSAMLLKPTTVIIL